MALSKAANRPEFTPGPPEGLPELLDAQFRTSLRPTLRVVGGIYVILSGAIFLQTRAPASWTGLMWAATAGLGVLFLATAYWIDREVRGTTILTWLAGALAVGLVVHALGLAWAFADPSHASFLFAILAASGYFFVQRGPLVAVLTVGTVGWFAVLAAIGIAWNSPSSGAVGAGVVIAIAAHLARRRHLVEMVESRLNVLSHLHASENRFRTLAETAKDAIMLVDEAGRLTYLNPSGLQLFGISNSEAQGRFLSQLVSNGGADIGAMVGTHEVEGLRRDGSKFPAELSLVKTEHEEHIGYTGVLRDATERKRAAAESRAAAGRETDLGQLRKMNEFKTRFLNMAAHELNTPLTPLRLQLHLLKAGQMGELNERQTKAVALLDRNVARLSGLVNEILEVARLQSGRLKMALQPVGVDEVVDEVLDSFAETARGVGVDLTYSGQQGLVAMADRNRLTQVLFNLVSNALKFTPAGGKVTVEAAPKGETVEVIVRDTGLGLTKEQMGRLFQPFVQVHDPMVTTVAGTGLGLYICKGLIAGHGGEISCSSAGPGRGSTFTFTLRGSAGAEAIERPVVVPEDPLVRRLRELI